MLYSWDIFGGLIGERYFGPLFFNVEKLRVGGFLSALRFSQIPEEQQGWPMKTSRDENHLIPC